MGTRHWTDTELKQLRIMAERGETDELIGGIVERSALAVEKKRRELGIERGKKGRTSPWTKREDELLLELRGKGKSAEQIATALGRTVPAVWQRSSVLGITRDYTTPEAGKQIRFETPEMLTVNMASGGQVTAEALACKALSAEIKQLTARLAELEAWASKSIFKRGAYRK